MRIKKIIQLVTLMTILYSFMLPINLSGQSFEKVTDTMISTVKRIVDTKTVILLENKDLIIKVSLTDFRNNIEKLLKEHPQLKKDKKLLDLLIHESKNAKTIRVSNIIKADSNLIPRLEYRIASLLENGRCLILNKKTRVIISEVRLQNYDYYIDTNWFDSAGRRFYVDKILILQVQDIIS